MLGDNAQGKTNILEAIYLMATLRSFRGVGGAQMIRHGAEGLFRRRQRACPAPRHEIKIYWSARERKLALDGQPVRRLGDYLGTLRAVVFCTEDLQLVKGTARVAAAVHGFATDANAPRLSAVAATLHRRLALPQRAAQTRAPDQAALEGFTRQLVEAGTALMKFRRELGAEGLSARAGGLCAGIGVGAKPWNWNISPRCAEDFAVELAQSRARGKGVPLNAPRPAPRRLAFCG